MKLKVDGDGAYLTLQQRGGSARNSSLNEDAAGSFKLYVLMTMENGSGFSKG